MKIKHIIIALVIVLLILFFTQKKEHAGSTPSPSSPSAPLLSNEAIQNIAKVYADTSNTATFNNINVTGEIKLPNWKGMITMWSGSVEKDKIPAGWALCDGEIVNGFQTPDLRGRFILGYGKGDGLTQRDMTAKGGEENVTLTEGQMPTHNHTIRGAKPLGRPDGGGDWGGGWNSKGYGYYVDVCNRPGYEANCNDATNIAQTTSKGSNQAHNNMPPFYVLAYIIKL